MFEVLDENQIEPVDTEINIDAIVNSYEQSSVDNASNTEPEEKSGPLSPNLGDYVSDPEKYELEYENSGNTFCVAEDGSIDLERNGQSMTELMESIAADDRTSDCRSAFYDAYHSGVGVITSESDSEYFIMLIVRESETEASWITYKGSKEVLKDEIKEKQDEEQDQELEDRNEFKPEPQLDPTVQPGAIDDEIASAEHANQTGATDYIFKTFSDFNQFLKTASLSEQAENGNVPNSVDNVVSEVADLHENIIAESSTDTSAETPTEIIEPAISIALEDAISNGEPSAIELLEKENVISATEEVATAPVLDIHIDTAIVIIPLAEQAPAVEQSPAQSVEQIGEQQTGSYVNEFEGLSYTVPIVESVSAGSPEADKSDFAIPTVIPNERPEHFTAIEELDEIPSAVLEVAAVIAHDEKSDVALSVDPSKFFVARFAEEPVDLHAETIENIPSAVVDTPKTPEEASGSVSVTSIEQIKDTKVLEVPPRVQSSELPSGPSEPMDGGPAIEREPTDIRTIQEQEDHPLLFEAETDTPITPSQFEIANTTSLIETGIGIRSEKPSEIAHIEIRVADKITMGDEIAMLAGTVEKAAEHSIPTISSKRTTGSEQTAETVVEISDSFISQIFTEDTDDIRPGNLISMASKSNNQLQSQISAATGISLIRSNPSYIYGTTRPSRGANSTQNITQNNNDAQESQLAVRLAKAA
jgi:hypothetical protein